jgi:hypothetical protein
MYRMLISTCSKRVSRRAFRGLGLIQAALSTGLIVIVLSAATALWSNYVFRAGLQSEARAVSALAQAAKTHIIKDFDTHLNAITLSSNSVVSLNIDDLTASESYAPGAPRVTSRKRVLSVLMWSPTPTQIIVLAQAQFATGETGRVGVPRGSRDISSTGWVAPHNSTEIQGPGIRLDISALQTAGIAIGSGDLVSLEFVSFGRDVSPYLHRIAQVGRPQLNQMETDLDLNGNNLEDVGTLTATNLVVLNGLSAQSISGATSVLGNLTASGNMTVSQTLNIGGNLTVTGTAAAQNLNVAQRLETTEITATNATFGTLSSDQINAVQVTVSGQVTTQTLNADAVNTDNAVVQVLESSLGLLNGTTQAQNLVSNTVITGSCSGC